MALFKKKSSQAEIGAADPSFDATPPEWGGGVSPGQKFAHVLLHDGQSWVIGGHWSASGRFPKRPVGLKKLAREEGFDPKQSGFVWLREEQQTGWFVFGDKPLKAKPLAALAARRLTAAQLPWRGLFCLADDLWWLVVTDASGALNPKWDIFGAHDDVLNVINDNLAELAPITHQEIFNTPQESWEWLLGDEAEIRNLPMVVPALSAESAAKKVLMVAAPIGLAAAGAVVGLTWWKHKQEMLQQQAMTLAQQRAAALAQLSKQQQEQQERAMIARIQAQWAAIPRPWQQAVAWSDALKSCQIGPVSIDGWQLTQVDCKVQGAQMQIARTFKRLPFATVFAMPQGELSADGNAVVQTQTVSLPAAPVSAPLPSVSDAQRTWMGLSQRWATVTPVTAAAAQPYRPPYPPNTPPQVQQKLPQPVLWNSISVSVQGATSPASWPVLGTPYFLPDAITLALSGGSLQWTLKGTQYAAP